MKKIIQFSTTLAIAFIASSAYASTVQQDTLIADTSVTTNTKADIANSVDYKNSQHFFQTAKTQTSPFQRGCSCELCQSIREYNRMSDLA